jgi:hypothetical protein
MSARIYSPRTRGAERIEGDCVRKPALSAKCRMVRDSAPHLGRISPSQGHSARYPSRRTI